MNGQCGRGSKNSLTFGKLKSLKNIRLVSCGVNFTVCVAEETCYGFGCNIGFHFGGPDEICYAHPIELLNCPSHIISIACGFVHTLFLTSEGHVFGCGNNSYGEVGQNHKLIVESPTVVDGLPPIIGISAGTHYSIALAEDRTCWMFGENILTEENKPIEVPELCDILVLSQGGSTVYAKNYKGEIWEWKVSKASPILLEAEYFDIIKNLHFKRAKSATK